MTVNALRLSHEFADLVREGYSEEGYSEDSFCGDEGD
jgi:hypothetical protein